MKRVTIVAACIFACWLPQNMIGQKDSAAYWSEGIIPYQLFSRSSAAFLGYQTKSVRYEYRLAYSYVIRGLELLEYYLPDKDRFHYHGWTNELIVSCFSPVSVGVVVGFKSWSYSDEWILIDKYSDLQQHENLMERRSAAKYGPIIGLQMEKNHHRRKFEWSIYVNSTVTFFWGKVNFQETNHTYLSSGNSYPYSKSFNNMNYNFALGFKLGLSSR